MTAFSGQLDAEEYSTTWLGVVYIVTYVVIVVILLLNLLVAEMGDTYSKGIDHADRSWLLERARIIFSIEYELSEEERLEPANRYWITIAGKRYIQVEEIDEEWGMERGEGGEEKAGEKDEGEKEREREREREEVRRMEERLDEMGRKLDDVIMKLEGVLSQRRAADFAPLGFQCSSNAPLQSLSVDLTPAPAPLSSSVSPSELSTPPASPSSPSPSPSPSPSLPENPSKTQRILRSRTPKRK